MRELFSRLGLILTLILSGLLLSGQDGEALTVHDCKEPDRNASFSLDPDRIPAFRASVASFGGRGGRIFETAGSDARLMQVTRARNRGWSYYVVSTKGETWAEARFAGGERCDQPLSETEAQAWGGFLQALAAEGFPADATYQPRLPG